LSTWEEADSTFLEDCTSDNLYAHYPEDDQDDIPLHLLQLGKGEIRRQRETMTMQNIMTNLGWTAENQVNTHTNIELNPLPIQRNLSGLEWKNEVAKKRHEVLEQRKQRMPANHKLETEQSFEQLSSNIVKIADKSYLTKKIHKPDTQQVLDIVVKKFSLNTEQEKAFRIVATHASDPYSEPL
jgi:hypothetical protein